MTSEESQGAAKILTDGAPAAPDSVADQNKNCETGSMLQERKYPKVFYALKKEMRLAMLTLNAVPKSDHDPTWRMQYCLLGWYRPSGKFEHDGWFQGSKVNFMWRLVLWGLVLFALFKSLSIFKFDHHWAYDFPHWNLMLQSVQQTNDLILATGATWVGEHKGYMRWVRLLRSLVQPICTHNFLVFFILMWKIGTPIREDVKYTHFLTFAVVVMDVFMGSHRSPRVLHLLYATMFGATWITWSNIHYHLDLDDGNGNRYIGPGMNWANWDATWEMIAKAMFGICPMTVPILWTIMYTRERCRPLSDNEYRHPLTGLPQIKSEATGTGMHELAGVSVVPGDGGPPQKGMFERGFKVADEGGGGEQGASNVEGQS